MKFFEKKTGENDSGTPEMQDMGPENGGGKFSPKRIVIGVIATVVLLWLLSTVIGFFMPSASKEAAENELITDNSGEDLSDQDLHSTAGGSDTSEISPHATQSSTDSDSQDVTIHGTKESITETLEPGQHAPGESTPPITLPVPKTSEDTPDKEAATPHEPVAHGTHDQRPGIATTKAIIEVLEYELRGRWWGWRPNDLIQITDNVQHYQLGVLEVSRRAVVTLAERMSRTGSTALYDPNLEMAMNWIMVKAESYWFPSAESKYKETIMDMQGYLERMEKGSALFFTRTDNLIPLLASFEDLLGSCDEILLKSKEDDGTNVSFFKVDDYFYYTKGVIDSMLTILEAVREDYYKTLESRRSLEIIDHALHSLEHGEHINPWIVLDSDLDSIFANHRSNLAGPVSHARFHLGLLIKALST
ncbi:MAG: DUF2333 family protein [Desulfobacterales bacterium]|nr:DUF2333 family protein [Desulfobacterales bacterium]